MPRYLEDMTEDDNDRKNKDTRSILFAAGCLLVVLIGLLITHDVRFTDAQMAFITPIRFFMYVYVGAFIAVLIMGVIIKLTRK